MKNEFQKTFAHDVIIKKIYFTNKPRTCMVVEIHVKHMSIVVIFMSSKEFCLLFDILFLYTGKY